MDFSCTCIEWNHYNMIVMWEKINETKSCISNSTSWLPIMLIIINTHSNGCLTLKWEVT